MYAISIIASFTAKSKAYNFKLKFYEITYY